MCVLHSRRIVKKLKLVQYGTYLSSFSVGGAFAALSAILKAERKTTSDIWMLYAFGDVEPKS
jgi:hypothetical protein